MISISGSLGFYRIGLVLFISFVTGKIWFEIKKLMCSIFLL